MSLGDTLRRAREEKKLTASQVAEATRMLSQVVEDLEREDYRRIAAPIYGRGFIKIYADFLGLPSEPLIREFMEIYTGLRPPQVMRRPMAENLDEKTADVPLHDVAVAIGEGKEATTFAALAGCESHSVDEVARGLDLFSAAANRDTLSCVLAAEAPSTPVVSMAHESVLRGVQPESAPLGQADGMGKDSGFLQALRDWLPPDWTLMRLGLTILAVLLAAGVLVLGVRALKKIVRPHTNATLKIERVTQPPQPYFD